jgi:hypothetical protein
VPFKTFLIGLACIFGFGTGCLALFIFWILFQTRGGTGQCCPTIISCYPCDSRLTVFDYLWLLLGLLLIVSTPLVMYRTHRRWNRVR